MSTTDIDKDRHDVCFVSISGESYDALAQRCGPNQSVSELVATLLADESQWPRLLNKITKPQRPEAPSHVALQQVHCMCCPRVCRLQWYWRGTMRCGCNKERLRELEGSRP